MVNIDTVYQRVLAIANKEQRGYITPLEFNLLANQAQLVVFEQYFYDRHKVAQIPGSKINHSDIDVMLDEKISLFERRDVPFVGFLPIDLYRLDSIIYQEPDPNSRLEWNGVMMLWGKKRFIMLRLIRLRISCFTPLKRLN